MYAHMHPDTPTSEHTSSLLQDANVPNKQRGCVHSVGRSPETNTYTHTHRPTHSEAQAGRLFSAAPTVLSV